MKIVGKYEVISNISLLVPTSEKASVEVDVHGWKIKLGISFDDSASEIGVDFEQTSQGANIIFQKWNNTLGLAFNEPHKLADLKDGGTLHFLAIGVRIGNLNRLDLQFMHAKGFAR